MTQGSRIFYYNIDSIIYIQDENEPNHLTEEYFLCFMADELQVFGPDTYITEVY